MALTFPNPAVDPEYIAPNGITYVWDDTDEKWRVKAFRSQDDVLVIVGDTPPDDPKSGDLWWDNASDSMTLFIYEGSAWVPAAPPVSLDGINATIDAALLVQEDLTARVSAGETIQSDLQDVVSTALDTQTSLENRIEALEGTVISGKWALDNRSIAREGHFIPFTGLTASVVWAGTDTLQIHPNSADGQSYTFAEVSIGDVIRIGSTGSSAIFKCLNNAQLSGDVYNISVELLNSSGEPFPTLEYNFEFLNAFDPSAYATISYVDAQDDLDLKLAVANDVTTGFRIKNDGNTLISTATAGELALYHVKDPTSGNSEWAATKGYVDTKADDYVPIDGGPSGFVNMTGSLGFDGGPEATGANLYLKDKGFIRWGYGDYGTQGEYGGYIYMRDDTTFEIGTYTDVDLKINATNPEFVHSPSVPTPSEDDHAANRGYVDTKVDGNFIKIAGQTDLDPQVFKIRQLNSSGTFNSFINIHDSQMHLYNVVNPSGSGHEKWAANKEYVDTQIAALPNANLDNYLPLAGGTVTGNLTVEGVAQFASAKNPNAPVAAADLTNKEFTDTTYALKSDRPGLKFEYQSGSDLPATGKFTWYNSGGQKMKINATTKDGIPWGVDTPIVDVNFSEGHMFTIWATVSNSNNWRIKRTGTINRIDYHANDILCYVSFSADNGSFSTTATYNITIAGIF